MNFAKGWQQRVLVVKIPQNRSRRQASGFGLRVVEHARSRRSWISVPPAQSVEGMSQWCKIPFGVWRSVLVLGVG